MEIVKYGNAVLRQKAKPIKKIDSEIEALVKRMFEVMNEHEGVGLAAPQIGVPRQVFVAWIPGEPPEKLVLINPRIIEAESEWEFEEGCLSIPGITGVCIRPKDIVVEGTTLEGEPVRKRYTGIAARIIQHEVDHLNGILFIDRLNKTKQTLVKTKLKKLAKKIKASE